MLIVEGVDGVGKTTLCKRLLKALPTHVYSHFTRLPSQFDGYWGYVERASPRIVQDRFHLSEVVYANIREEAPVYGPETLRLIEAKLRQLGSFNVLLCADPYLIKERWTPDQLYDLGKTMTAADRFNQLATGIWSEWKFDMDLIYVLNKEKPYVDEDDVAEILRGYSTRQGALDRVIERRPPSLQGEGVL